MELVGKGSLSIRGYGCVAAPRTAIDITPIAGGGARVDVLVQGVYASIPQSAQQRGSLVLDAGEATVLLCRIVNALHDQTNTRSSIPASAHGNVTVHLPLRDAQVEARVSPELPDQLNRVAQIGLELVSRAGCQVCRELHPLGWSVDDGEAFPDGPT